MKALITLIMALSLVIGTSCTEEYYVVEDPVAGPVGPQGPAGVDAENAFVFEYTNIDFTAPDYEVFVSLPDDFEPYASDVALVYFLWDTYQTNDGEVVEVWRELEQTILTDDGVLQYNFDFSMYDLRLFMDATFPLDLLGAIDTDDWIARVVIVPGDFWNSGRVDLSTYDQVKEAFHIDDSKIHRSSQSPRRN